MSKPTEIEIRRREFRDYANDVIRPALSQIVSPGVDPVRLIKVLLACVNRNDKLLQCTKASFVRAIMQAGELGLELGGTLGEASIIPYERNWKDGDTWRTELEAQFQLGYQGYITLARRSPLVSNVQAITVYERDHFELEIGPSERVVHRPWMGGSDESAGPLRAVYAFAKLANGIVHIERPMLIPDIEKIRRRSKTYNGTDKPWRGSPPVLPGQNSGPWGIGPGSDDYDRMALKTILIRICKSIPRSTSLARALEIEVDNDTTAPPPDAIVDMTPSVSTTRELGVKPVGPSLKETLDRKAAEDAARAIPVVLDATGVAEVAKKMVEQINEATEVMQTLKEQRADPSIDPEKPLRGGPKKPKPATVETVPAPAEQAAPANVAREMPTEVRAASHVVTEPLAPPPAAVVAPRAELVPCAVCLKPCYPAPAYAHGGAFRHPTCDPAKLAKPAWGACFVCDKAITDPADGVPGNSARGAGRFRHQACSPVLGTTDASGVATSDNADEGP